MKKNIFKIEDSIYEQKGSNNGKIGILAIYFFGIDIWHFFIHKKWIFNKIEYMFMIFYNTP